MSTAKRKPEDEKKISNALGENAITMSDTAIKKPAIVFDTNQVYTMNGPIKADSSVQLKFFDVNAYNYESISNNPDVINNECSGIIYNNIINVMIDNHINNILQPFETCIYNIFNTAMQCCYECWDVDSDYNRSDYGANFINARSIIHKSLKYIILSENLPDSESLYALIYSQVIGYVNGFGLEWYNSIRRMVINDINPDQTKKEIENMLNAIDPVFCRAMYCASYESGVFSMNARNMAIFVNYQMKLKSALPSSKQISDHIDYHQRNDFINDNNSMNDNSIQNFFILNEN